MMAVIGNTLAADQILVVHLQSSLTSVCCLSVVPIAGPES